MFSTTTTSLLSLSDPQRTLCKLCIFVLALLYYYWKANSLGIKFFFKKVPNIQANGVNTKCFRQLIQIVESGADGTFHFQQNNLI